MNKQFAIDLFKSIQNGRGTGDFRDEFIETFPNGRGNIAINEWHNGIFTLGVEYGILIALMKIFDLKREDIYKGAGDD